jgi:hypothetical protein
MAEKDNIPTIEKEDLQYAILSDDNLQVIGDDTNIEDALTDVTSELGHDILLDDISQLLGIQDDIKLSADAVLYLSEWLNVILERLMKLSIQRLRARNMVEIFGEDITNDFIEDINKFIDSRLEQQIDNSF